MLTFEFVGFYEDGSVFYQHADTENEMKFADIDQSKLKTLALTGKNKTFGVSMNGLFNINGVDTRFEDCPEGLEYRPIYFRRIRQNFMPDMIETITKYAVGIQATVDGKNIQKILLVDDYGNLEVINKK